MAGADWVLRSWTATEPAASEPAVTLVFEGGRFAGHAGCNRYTAGVEAGDQPGDIAVGPIAGTRMMCPEPVMATETRFLHSLGDAGKFTFVGGQLALTSEQDGTFSTMYFDRATPR
jgi:heat shock protein HslJ